MGPVPCPAVAQQCHGAVQVDTLPPTEPQSAIWYFGWHVTDVRKSWRTTRLGMKCSSCRSTPPMRAAPSLVSSDTWPISATSRLTRGEQIAEARAGNVQPKGGGGFAYMAGPDNALAEYAGNYPAERFNHVHPGRKNCLRRAALVSEAPERPGPRWLRWPVSNRGRPAGHAAQIAPGRRSICRACSAPHAGVEFGEVVLTWALRQSGRHAPGQSTRPTTDHRAECHST